jgi:hypothetical protein
MNSHSLDLQLFLLYSFRPQNKFNLVQPASKSVSVPQVYKNHPLSPTISQVLWKFTEIIVAIWNLIAYEIDFIFLLISITSRLLLISSQAPMQSNTEQSIALIPPSNYCPLLDRNPLQQLSSPRQSFIPKVMSIWNIIEAKLQSITYVIPLSCDQSLYKISLKLQFFSSDFGKSLIWKCYRSLLSSSKSQKNRQWYNTFPLKALHQGVCCRSKIYVYILLIIRVNSRIRYPKRN